VTQRSDGLSHAPAPDMKHFDYDNFLELEAQGSFSADLNMSCSGISKMSRRESPDCALSYVVHRRASDLLASEAVQYSESRDEDITLHSASESSGDERSEGDASSYNIDVPAYDSNEDFRPHKSPEQSIACDMKASQMPSKRSHFSRMGSIFVTDSSEEERSCDNVSMTSNFLNVYSNAESKRLARRNTQKALFCSLSLLRKESGYTIKAHRAPRSSFMLSINKSAKTAAPLVPINLKADDVSTAASTLSVCKEKKPRPVSGKAPEKKISVIKESADESFEESGDEEVRCFLYDAYVDKAVCEFVAQRG